MRGRLQGSYNIEDFFFEHQGTRRLGFLKSFSLTFFTFDWALSGKGRDGITPSGYFSILSTLQSMDIAAWHTYICTNLFTQLMEVSDGLIS